MTVNVTFAQEVGGLPMAPHFSEDLTAQQQVSTAQSRADIVVVAPVLPNECRYRVEEEGAASTDVGPNDTYIAAGGSAQFILPAGRVIKVSFQAATGL